MAQSALRNLGLSTTGEMTLSFTIDTADHLSGKLLQLVVDHEQETTQGANVTLKDVHISGISQIKTFLSALENAGFINADEKAAFFQSIQEASALLALREKAERLGRLRSQRGQDN